VRLFAPAAERWQRSKNLDFGGAFWHGFWTSVSGFTLGFGDTVQVNR